MSAAVQSEFSALLLASVEGIDSAAEKKSRRSPKKRPTRDSASTKLVSGDRSLPTEQDVLAATDWRLGAWNELQITAGVERVRQLLADGLQVNDEALAGLDMPVDRRDPWTAVCALMVLCARVNGDRVLFWRAGYAVIMVCRQTQLAALPRGYDALSLQIIELLASDPNVTAAATFERWADLANSNLVGCVCDACGDTLWWEDDRKAIHSIDRTAFARRFNRLKKLKTQPANVPDVRYAVLNDQQPESSS